MFRLSKLSLPRSKQPVSSPCVSFPSRLTPWQCCVSKSVVVRSHVCTTENGAKDLNKKTKSSTTATLHPAHNHSPKNQKQKQKSTQMDKFVLEPIGYMETCWKQKQGTPRQSMIIPNARGKLRLTMSSTYEQKHRYKSHLGSRDMPQRANTYHFVEGLEEFSHIWLFWIFHQNFHVQQLATNGSPSSPNAPTADNVEETQDNNSDSAQSQQQPQQQQQSLPPTSLTAASLLNKAKVKPPRLAGKKVGALACRSPYRPNPLGMSVVKLDRIELVEETQETILHLSGVDLVDGTPIIDIKPYIPEYDILQSPEHHVTIPGWMREMRKQFSIDHVIFLQEALDKLRQFQSKSEFYGSGGDEDLEALKQVIAQSIRLDPRSTYRRNKFGTEVFGMCVDVFNIFVSINDQDSVATVLDVEDWSGGIPSKEELKLKKFTGAIPTVAPNNNNNGGSSSSSSSTANDDVQQQEQQHQQQ